MNVGVGVAVGVGAGVAVGVAVAVGVGVAVGVAVGAGVAVAVGAGVGDAVAAGVGVALVVPVVVAVAFRVGVAVAFAGVGVAVAFTAGVGVAVRVGDPVGAAVGGTDSVSVGAAVPVTVGVAVTLSPPNGLLNSKSTSTSGTYFPGSTSGTSGGETLPATAAAFGKRTATAAMATTTTRAYGTPWTAYASRLTDRSSGVHSNRRSNGSTPAVSSRVVDTGLSPRSPDIRLGTRLCGCRNKASDRLGLVQGSRRR